MKLKFLIFFFTSIQVSYAQLVCVPATLQHVIVEDQITTSPTFVLKNIGASPIHINDISVSCGCVSVYPTALDVLPGKTEKLICNINNVSSLNNKLIHSIVVSTDHISSTRITLLLELISKNICDISPRLLFWRKGSKCIEKELSIVLNSKNACIKQIIFPESFICKKITDSEERYIIVPKSTQTKIHENIKIIISSNNKIYTKIIHLFIK
ncbi:MAG: DUF1573 domain-containing protein [Opitutales bacterium]|nr:DUF1573 domain-containing protein [Opitutales bacterium]